MDYKNEIEKVAQSRWRKYLDSINSEDDIWDYVADLTRNRPGSWSHPAGITNREELGSDKKAIKQLLSSEDGLKRGGISAKVENILNTPYKNLSSGDLELRRNLAEEMADDRTLQRRVMQKPGRRTSMGIQTALDAGPDDYVSIINGTNKSRGMAFLRGGNGATKLQGRASLLDGTVNDKGLQVHSKVRDRADSYAKMQSQATGGSPAVLMGKIKRKYLHPNASQANGAISLSDEYGIPEQYFNKIKDAKLFNPETMEMYESLGDISNRLPYGRTKTPGSLTALEKSTRSNAFKEKAKTPIIPQSNALVPAGNKGFTMVGNGTITTPAKPVRSTPKATPKPQAPLLLEAPKKAPIKPMAGVSADDIANMPKLKQGLSRNAKIGLGLGAGALALGAGAYGLKKLRDKKKEEKKASQVHYELEIEKNSIL